MRLEQLEYVIAVSDYGSMNIAAQYLHVSQQNISKSIKQLEEELQIDIFSRSKRGTHLTKQGELFYQFACKQMEEYEQLKERLEKIQFNMLQGTLNICTMNGGMSMVVPQLLSEFYKDYPNVKLNIQEGNMNFALEQVEKGFADMAIVMLTNLNGEIRPKIPEDLKMIPLMKGDWYFWVSKNSAYAKRGFITLEEVSKEPFLVDSALDLEYLKETFMMFNLQVDIGMRTQNLYLLGKLAAEGQGIIPDAKFENDDLLYSYVFKSIPNLITIPAKIKDSHTIIAYLLKDGKKRDPLLLNTTKFLDNYFSAF